MIKQATIPKRAPVLFRGVVWLLRLGALVVLAAAAIRLAAGVLQAVEDR